MTAFSGTKSERFLVLIMVNYEWTGQWDKEIKRNLLFNQNIPFNQLRYPLSFNDELSAIRLEENWFYWSGLNWCDDQSQDYYWSSAAVNITEAQWLNEISIYPIPTSNLLHV